MILKMLMMVTMIMIVMMMIMIVNNQIALPNSPLNHMYFLFQLIGSFKVRTIDDEKVDSTFKGLVVPEKPIGFVFTERA